MESLLGSMDPINIYNIVQTGGVAALLIIILVGGWKRWWVFGWQYKAIEESNARWMELALRSTNLAESVDDLRKQSGLKLQ